MVLQNFGCKREDQESGASLIIKRIKSIFRITYSLGVRKYAQFLVSSIIFSEFQILKPAMVHPIICYSCFYPNPAP